MFFYEWFSWVTNIIYTSISKILKVVAQYMGGERTVLSFNEALYMVIRSIKLRFGRILVVIVAITASIAYMVSLELLAPIIATTSSPEAVAIYTTLLSITAIVVAIAGTMNSLLILIGERYHEIGTMKSFGARDIHIFKLLILESLILTLIGGFLGYLIGIAIGYGLGGRGDPIYLLGKSIGVSVAIGLIATLYPSYHAAKLSPVEALRVEV